MTEHRQVLLPELGFTVDEGLEELIELCWRRGIATGDSCVEDRASSSREVRPDSPEGQGHVTVVDELFAMRWEALTGHDVTWCDGSRWGVEKYPVVFFHRDEIPILVAYLRAGWWTPSPATGAPS
jgi:hypothetical protein